MTQAFRPDEWAGGEGGIKAYYLAAAILMGTDVDKLAILLVPVIMLEIYRFCFL